MINSNVSYHILLGRSWLHKHCLIPSTYHQRVKGRLNGRPIRIPASSNPFSQGEVNFVETVFYNELVPDDESPIPRTSGAPVLEKEEEGRGTYNLRNLLDRKRQKKEASSSGSRECVVVQEPNIPLMKVRGTQMHYAGRSRTTRLYDGSRKDLGGSRQRSTYPA